MMTERALTAEQNFLGSEFPCGAENLSPPYSNASSYSEPSTYYHTDYEWQQSQQQQQQPLVQHLAHEHTISEPERHFYTLYPPGTTVTPNPYSYSQHHGNSEYFQQTPPELWTPMTPRSVSNNELPGHHRFFSGIDVNQQSRISSPSIIGHNGKPKRKRVQSCTQRKAANVRERRRMFHLNEAFDELRKRLPAFNYEKRLSRIETLRLAMTYISFMKDVSVGTDPQSIKLKPHGAELSDLDDQSPYSCKNDSGENFDRDSDCSGDEMSNHSG